MATQDEYIKTALRLPRSLHARVQESAEATGKSMNAELIARLESSFNATPDSTLEVKIDHLSAQNDQLQYMLDAVLSQIFDTFKLNTEAIAQKALKASGLEMSTAEFLESHEKRKADTAKRVLGTSNNKSAPKR